MFNCKKNSVAQVWYVGGMRLRKSRWVVPCSLQRFYIASQKNKSYVKSLSFKLIYFFLIRDDFQDFFQVAL